MSFWVAGAAIGGAVLSSEASKSAAGTQAGSSAAALAAQQAQSAQTRADQAPYRAAGVGALNQMSNLLGVDSVSPTGGAAPGSFDGAAYLAANPDVASSAYWSQRPEEHYLQHGQAEGRAGTYVQAPQPTTHDASFGSYATGPTAAEVQMDPGYQFGLTQGQEAIDRKAAAGGGRISGAALKAAAQYGTDYATTGYSTAYNRVNQARSDRLNRLAALAGIGQTGTQQVTASGQNTANNTSNILTAQGNASGAAQIAQSNIWGGAGNQLAALYGRGGGSTSVPAGQAVNLGTVSGSDLSTFY